MEFLVLILNIILDVKMFEEKIIINIGKMYVDFDLKEVCDDIVLLKCLFYLELIINVYIKNVYGNIYEKYLRI